MYESVYAITSRQTQGDRPRDTIFITVRYERAAATDTETDRDIFVYRYVCILQIR